MSSSCMDIVGVTLRSGRAHIFIAVSVEDDRITPWRDAAAPLMDEKRIAARLQSRFTESRA